MRRALIPGDACLVRYERIPLSDMRLEVSLAEMNG